MNYKMVLKSVAKVLILEGVLLLLPFVVSIIYNRGDMRRGGASVRTFNKTVVNARLLARGVRNRRARLDSGFPFRRASVRYK